MVENHWSSRLSSVLMIDRPSGFQGHGGGNGEKFMKTYGACLVQFVTTASLPAHLVHPGDFCASPKEGSRPGIAPRA
jgi:hypothetical protein